MRSQGDPRESRYSIGVNVKNTGSKGVDKCRVTVFFPVEIRLLDGDWSFNQDWKPSFAYHDIGGKRYRAMEMNVGPIFAEDTGLWLCTLRLFTSPGHHTLKWVIASEDGRRPESGHNSLKENFPAPPPQAPSRQ